MTQTNLSGSINFTPYRHILTATLTDNEFVVSFINPIIRIPIAEIHLVEQVRNIWRFGIKVRYYYKPAEIHAHHPSN